jgi:putative DNA-invertase from lambdoid prophage Rac
VRVAKPATNGHASRVALYARVSSANHGQDPEVQLRELREATKARGLHVVEEFVDHGVNGSLESRPALNRMMAAAETHEFDALLVWRLDRLGRSLKNLVVTLDHLDKIGVGLISLKEHLDLTTPAGRLQFHIISAMAQFEKELMRERTVAGLAAARAKGKRLGAPPRKDINTSAIVRLREAGHSWRAIEKQLGVSQATCRSRYARATNVPLAVWKIDRLGRSLKHLVVTLAELDSLGVSFISLKDNLDLSTPSGRLMFQIIGAMGEFEKALIQGTGPGRSEARASQRVNGWAAPRSQLTP